MEVESNDPRGSPLEPRHPRSASYQLLNHLYPFRVLNDDRSPIPLPSDLVMYNLVDRSIANTCPLPLMNLPSLCDVWGYSLLYL